VSTGRNVWFITSLVAVSALVLTSALSFHYYAQYVAAEKRYTDTLSSLNDVSYKVNILVKYSNGTKSWYNQTIIPIGWSLFNATSKATGGKVEGSWSSFGVFVTSINGVKGVGPDYWLWFTWDASKKEWVSGPTGADSHIMKQGETVAWLLTADWTATP